MIEVVWIQDKQALHLHQLAPFASLHAKDAMRILQMCL